MVSRSVERVRTGPKEPTHLPAPMGGELGDRSLQTQTPSHRGTHGAGCLAVDTYLWLVLSARMGTVSGCG